MIIVFASTGCSKQKYQQIFELRKTKMIDPAQKFLEQLISGLSKANVARVISISARQVSASTTDQRIFYREEEQIMGVEYIYPGFLNGKFSRVLSTYITSFLAAQKVFRDNKSEEIVLVCDPLCAQVAAAAKLAALFAGIKRIAIVTDIPTYATQMKQHKYSNFRKMLQYVYEHLIYRDIVRYDAYINLTKYMNPLVNPKKKPFVVLEGSVDVDTATIEKVNHSQSKRIVMYAGGVYEKYGLKNLAEGFLLADIQNAELHIYGEGSYVEELIQICDKNPNVKYMGVALNTDLPEIESKATLLVNSRFSGEDYTKYSFPSKTLEYMSSGTPVVTTRLAGIPEDYEPYLYYFEEESVEGMAYTLKTVLRQSDEELYAFGKKAKEFVLNEKNNLVQGQRIYEFAIKILKG